MTAQALLDELAAHGVAVRAVGQNLRLAPKAVVTPELTEIVRAHKPELLAFLRLRHFALLAAVGDLVEAINAHLTVCRICGMESYVTDNPGPLCQVGPEFWRRYREARRAALSGESSTMTVLSGEITP